MSNELSNTSENKKEYWRELKRAQRARQVLRPLSRFPSKFFEIAEYFNQMQGGAQKLEHVMEDESRAQQLRWKWYEFKKALKAQGVRRDLEDVMEKVVLKVEGKRMVFSWRDLEPAIVDFEKLIVPALTLNINTEGKKSDVEGEKRMEAYFAQPVSASPPSSPRTVAAPVSADALTVESLDIRGRDLFKQMMEEEL